MSEFEFTKSTYSSGDAHGECVEVARNIPTTIAVRDSKEPNGPLLRLTPTTWSAFTAHVGAV
ncbi:DUF397 domain-containing protein [Streptomyces prunicolor]|uniref:DUF397 domain-containing protein n=1 Tax=Streptomyces prunicolor TaxID=67348 RepID=UPI003863F17D|nr:DUF397 domain-containing protein [Streptomyces prunicolor]